MQFKSCPQKAPKRLKKVGETVLMDFSKASMTFYSSRFSFYKIACL